MDWCLCPADLRMCGQCQVTLPSTPPCLDWSWVKLLPWEIYADVCTVEDWGLLLLQPHCLLRVSHTLFSSHRLPAIQLPKPWFVWLISPDPLRFSSNVVLLLMASYMLYFKEPIIIIIPLIFNISFSHWTVLLWLTAILRRSSYQVRAWKILVEWLSE